MKNNIRRFIVLTTMLMFTACQAKPLPVDTDTVTIPTAETVAVTTVPTDNEIFVNPNGVYGEVTAKREELALSEEQYNDIEIMLIDKMASFDHCGSEIASAVTNLNYYGFDCTTEELVSYMPVQLQADSDGMWNSPDLYYLGNPSSVSSYCYNDPVSERKWYGCNAKVLKKTIENYFAAQNVNDYEVVDVSGSNFDELTQMVIEGTPVLVWGTYYFDEVEYGDTLNFTDGSTVKWIANQECFNLVGMDHYGICMTFMHSVGPIFVEKETAVDIYNKVGQQAIIIKKAE